VGVIKEKFKFNWEMRKWVNVEMGEWGDVEMREWNTKRLE
jgi:hypothetical protein